jgi:DNA-binding transcriptional LysR family regulator
VERIVQALDSMRDQRRGSPCGMLRISSVVGFGRKGGAAAARVPHLPSRIRVFVDFMTAQIRALDLHCLSNFSAAA